MSTGNKKVLGFSLVELIIVIVVIAILAAITIVSYSNVSARAKKSAALGNVESVQKVAEAIAADSSTSSYPVSVAQFTAGSLSTHLPLGVVIQKITGTTYSAIMTTNATSNAALMSPSPGNYIGVSAVMSGSISTGGMILFYDATLGTISPVVTYYGNANSSSTYTALT